MEKKFTIKEINDAYDVYRQKQVEEFKFRGGKLQTPEAVELIDTKIQPVLNFVFGLENGEFSK